MTRQLGLVKLLVLLIAVISFFTVAPIPVFATILTCEQTISSCDKEDIKIDFSCQRAQIINPNANCCVNYCSTGGATPTYIPNSQDNVLNVNFLGIGLHFNNATAVAQIILLVFSLALAVIALALFGRAAYAAYLRAQAEDAAGAAKAYKLIQNSVVGFVIIVIAIVVVQLVASFIGVGSITDIIDFSEFFDQSTILPAGNG